jgi:hypothetical protein
MPPPVEKSASVSTASKKHARAPRLSDAETVGYYLLDEQRVARYGAPTPEYRFAKPLRQWRLDYAYPALGVAIEIEGGTFTHTEGRAARHLTGSGYADDCRKYDVAALLGWIVIRVTTDMVAHGEAWALIDAALEMRRSLGELTSAPLAISAPLAATIARLHTPRKARAVA